MNSNMGLVCNIRFIGDGYTPSWNLFVSMFFVRIFCNIFIMSVRLCFIYCIALDSQCIKLRLFLLLIRLFCIDFRIYTLQIELEWRQNRKSLKAHLHIMHKLYEKNEESALKLSLLFLGKGKQTFSTWRFISLALFF